MEMLRPSGITPDMATSMMLDSTIPGHSAMTPLAKANWPLGEPKVDTPLKVAERSEMADDMVAKGYIPQSQYEELKAQLKQLQSEVSLKDVNPNLTASPEASTVTEQVRKKSKGSPWKCDWPECGEEMLTTQKGAHIGKHRREAKKAEEN